MTLDYYDKRQATVNVGHELRSRGWKLYGYHPDQSDSMTDYYHPASWDGVATHPDYPGVVAAVNVSEYDRKRHSGKTETETVHVPGETCDRCAGEGADPSGWTLEKAKADPLTYHRELMELEGTPNAVPLFPRAVSPIPFGSYGILKCRKCHGRGHALVAQTVDKDTWPAFDATPRGKFWAVQVNGKTVATGLGFAKCAGYVSLHSREGNATLTNVKAAADAIEAAARKATSGESKAPAAGKPSGTNGTNGAGSGDFTVTHDRDWTWISFPGKPAEEVRDALKGNLGARWSKRRSAWYITSPVTPEAVATALGAAA